MSQIRNTGSKFWAASYILSSYFFGRRVLCAQTAIFFAKPVSKNTGSQFLFFGGQLVSIIYHNPKQIGAAPRRIFSSNKSAPANRKNSIKTVGSVPKIKQEQVGGVFVIGDFKL